MAAVKTTWLSPRFDRANVLSKAIKVSPLFAPRDGWCFDDHDEKQYIDPERTVIPVMWQIFTGLFASFLITGRMDASLFREISKQYMIWIYDTGVYYKPITIRSWFDRCGLHYCTNKTVETAMGPLWGLQASTCILIGHRHAHPNVLSWGRAISSRLTPM